jgi:hypothetical protein
LYKSDIKMLSHEAEVPDATAFFCQVVVFKINA